MNKYLIYIFIISFFNSCYSPKSDIEEDKYPEMAEFPKFTDDKIVLEKIGEMNFGENSSKSFLVKNNLCIVYEQGKQLDDYQYQCQICIIKSGKLLKKISWKANSEYDGYITNSNDIIVANRKFIAPNYDTFIDIKKIDFEWISKKYEKEFKAPLGEPELDSLVHKKIKLEEIAFQKEIVSTINTIKCVSYLNDEGLTDYDLKNKNYLINEQSSNPLFIYGSFFNSLIKKDSVDFYEWDKLIIEKLKPKIEINQKKTVFVSEYTESLEKIRTTFFEEFDKVVVDNYWFSQGNHMVASFGYRPIYLSYSNIAYKNIKTKTKVNNTNQTVANPLKADDGLYFFQEINGKVLIWFLKN